MKLRIRIREALLAIVLIIGITLAEIPGTQAAIPSVSMGTIQVESYYNTLRKAFYLTSYDGAGACNGWVERVINKSGLVGKFVVGGDCEDLYKAMAGSSKFQLVASLKGGHSDYQNATDQMIRDVNAGKIKAGDIVIYTKNMKDPDNTPNPHWLHAAIVMKEKFDGTVENYAGSGYTRWKSGYIGYPTIAHALAPAWGVEYKTPMTTPSTAEADDGGSTGYYVFRIVTGKDENAGESGWVKSDKKWYYYENGSKQLGWQKISGKWYYFDDNGVMKTGWQKISGKWYFLKSSGVMKTGWQKSGKKWYYLKSNGVMKTGWKKLSGKRYYFRNDGSMVTGWKKISGNWYYFEKSGAMAAAQSIDLKGKSYIFGADGVCRNP
ncbi:MAG: N-acetylmuramoyl-L-alanine amidase family protein [Eubacterium sp.]|nr:N-acetylmuramoyl-L-alanine amidase family protein [Eubacterium sp.]